MIGRIWKSYRDVIVWGTVIGALAGLAGCAVLDGIIGVTETGEDLPGDSPAETAGGLLGTLIPGAAGAVGLLRWIYVEIRKRKLAGSFKAAVVGVTEAVDAAKGQPVEKAKLYEALTAASNLYANRKFFAEAVEKIKDSMVRPAAQK